MKLIFFVILGLLLFINAELSGSIVNTKHNLSSAIIPDMNRTILAQTEQEVCVFCHIPHVSRPVGKPLWNRSMPTTNYDMYDSTYLRRLGYPALETDLGTDNDTPGALSRQCLSCHDGTIAVGSVYKLRRVFMGTDKIAMDGVDGSGFIPAGAAGLIGTDLSVHHPVGVEYTTTLEAVDVVFDTGTRTAELLDPPTSPLKLYEYASYPEKKYVECSSCHDPHKEAANAGGESNKFLHVSSGTTLAENIVTTCISCHSKREGIAGADNPHNLLTDAYTTDGLAAEYGTAALNEFYCVNCHTPHNAQSGQAYLQRKVEQNTCYMGASDDRTTAPCHGTGSILASTKEIETVLNRSNGHGMVNDQDGVHTNLDTLYGTDITRFPADTKGLSFADSKHVECVDCHNPHKLAANKHVADADMYPTTPTNLVSPVLQGVNGVEPIWPTEWIQPTTFTTMESAEKEYQICLKCHSYWGLGNATWGVNTGGHETQDLATRIPLTDVAWEMNKNNKSGHPVVFSANERPNSTVPKALDALQLLDPWITGRGANTMYCSDCHGAEDETGVDPKGPHGSDQPFMLKGTNTSWPIKSSGVLYDLDDIDTSGDNFLFCKNCHDLTYPHKEWGGQMATENFNCVTCHVAIPHGSQVSRLIGYKNFPAPYNYGGNSLQISLFKKNPIGVEVGDFDTGRVYDADGGGGGCRGGACHADNAGGYDALSVTP